MLSAPEHLELLLIVDCGVNVLLGAQRHPPFSCLSPYVSVIEYLVLCFQYSYLYIMLCHEL